VAEDGRQARPPRRELARLHGVRVRGARRVRRARRLAAAFAVYVIGVVIADALGFHLPPTLSLAFVGYVVLMIAAAAAWELSE
jgi:hypothetical protein